MAQARRGLARRVKVCVMRRVKAHSPRPTRLEAPMRAILAVLALTLTACSRPPPEPAPPARSAPAPPAAARVQDYSRPITARGNEPFWALTLVGTQLTLKRPGQPDTVFIAPGAQITPGQARWTATSADGRTLTLTLF